MKNVEVPFNEKLATVVVDGVEREPNFAVYEKNAVLVFTDAFKDSPADFSGRGREPFRAALVVKDGSIAENMSVTQAIVGSSPDNNTLKAASITSTTPNFNHIIVENSEYTIEGCTLTADTDSDGKRVCDFNGYGALVCGYKGAKLTLKDCELVSDGVAKPVLFVDGGSDCLMTGCTYHCNGGTLYSGYKNAAGFTKMVAPPWVLGITGTARGTNLMGPQSTMTIADSICYATGWGVVSTDGGEELALYVVDSLLEIEKTDEMLDNPYIRRYGSGYGLYCCGADEFIYGTTINVGGYAVIGTGGNVTLASSDRTITPGKKYLVPTGQYAPQPPDGHMGEVKEVHWYQEPVFPAIKGKGKPTVINSDGFGFMFHGGCNIKLLEGTECNSDYAAFLVRACPVDIQVDDSFINAGDGTVIQMIDNDDKAVGGLFTPDIFDEKGNLIQAHTGPIFNHEFFEHPGFPGIDYDTECKANGEKVTAGFTNCKIEGSFYNATGYRCLGDGTQGQGEALELTFGTGAEVTGVITASSSKHIDEKGRDNNLFTINEYYYLGHVTNVPHSNGVNRVSVELTDNARWTVTGTCVLDSLTIGKAAAVTAPEGRSLKVTVNDAPVTIVPGNAYTGSIVIEVV